MKKRVIAIVVMVALVMSMVACGSTQAQPVQESTPATKTETAAEPAEETKVETPVVTEEPKAEESEVKEEPAAEVSVEPVEEESDIIDGIDFSSYNNEGEYENLDAIIKEQNYDSLKAVVIDGEEQVVRNILSDGDSIVIEAREFCILRYYAPKEVSRLEQIGPGACADFSSDKEFSALAIWDSVTLPLEKGENVPIGIKVTYADGSEETLELNATIK